METLKVAKSRGSRAALRDAGADMQVGAGKKMGGVTVDCGVVSGANTTAATALGNKFVEMLDDYRE